MERKEQGEPGNGNLDSFDVHNVHINPTSLYSRLILLLVCLIFSLWFFVSPNHARLRLQHDPRPTLPRPPHKLGGDGPRIPGRRV